MENTKKITVTEVTDLKEIYCRYDSQQQAQPVTIELRDGVLSASYDAEIGNAVPADVWDGRVMRWCTGLRTVDCINSIMHDIAEKLDDGETESDIDMWLDGCEIEDYEQVAEYEAGEWFEEETHRYTIIRNVITITSDTTEAEMQAVVAEYSYPEPNTIVHGIYDHLDELRAELID